jgi:hypothetical protein
VQLQIESPLAGRGVSVDLVADSLEVSSGSLQRGLATKGISDAEPLPQVQLRRASDGLRHTDKPMIEISAAAACREREPYTIPNWSGRRTPIPSLDCD